ncbi:iron chelate uptake ABC transporter family permease subunit [Actinomyces culturomici]|uniref:iron chelate uptake ABC transporter family permease subunit n=1 Tax=Actinomyces culturomici TaxID=1926276 RepID=UPI002287548C|nr:iron chelate uptake ABC transporter family permease subunit [Actinomyces culturomici]
MGAWFMGSFASAIEGQYEPVWAILLVLAGIAIVADRLTIAGLGKDVATSVGVDHGRVVLLGTAMVAMVTGIVTVVIGNLPFLGLIVPNIVSLIRGDDLRANLPWVFLVGAGTVTACDIVGRLVVMPFEIPVGTILAILGAAVFTALLLRGADRA